MKIRSLIALILISLLFLSFNTIIYARQAEGTDGSGSSTSSGISHTAGEVISEADSFISKGSSKADINLPQDKLKSLSNTIYNILLVIAIIVAVIWAAVLGIKFMLSGIEGKAEVQKSIIPFVVGCVIAFGAFTIWKIIVVILESM